MVKLKFAIIPIISITLFACAFFLKTPFDDAITTYQMQSDLTDTFKNALTDITINESTDIRLRVLNNILCVIIRLSESEQHIFIFNTSNLELLANHSGVFDKLFMLGTDNNYHIGNLILNTDTLENLGSLPTYPSNHFGFSFNGNNYDIFMENNFLNINVDTSGDFISESTGNTHVPLVDEYYLSDICYSYSDDNKANPILILWLSQSRWIRSQLLRIPLAGLSTPLQLTGNFPFNQDLIFLQPSDDTNYYLTYSGYSFKGQGVYYFYDYAGNPYPDESQNKNSNWILAYDQEGLYYYWFNKKTHIIYKYTGWWRG